MLLDEPLSALDANLRHDLQDQLKAIHRDTGTTFVCVTHDQDEALSMSDRVAVIRDGRILQLGTPQHLYKQPASRFVADFMGAKNVLALAVMEVCDGVARCVVDGVTLLQAVNGSTLTGSAITVAIRPSSISLGAGRGSNQVTARVESLSYMGSDIVMTIASEVGPLTLRHPAEHTAGQVSIGQQVIASWDPAAAMIVVDDI